MERPPEQVPPPSRLESVLVALAFLVVVLLIGQLGGAITAPALLDWYPTLAKPEFTPPNWVFPVAWTFLYILMAVAAWLVWRAAGGFMRAPDAFGFWALQLALNLAWSFLFFGLRSPGLGLLCVLALMVVIALTIAAFLKRSRPAAWLLIPYLLWVGFATALNFEIWRMN